MSPNKAGKSPKPTELNKDIGHQLGVKKLTKDNRKSQVKVTEANGEKSYAKPTEASRKKSMCDVFQKNPEPPTNIQGFEI